MIPRLLFVLAFALSFLLVVLVIAAPLVDNGEARLLSLFAHDPALRRTAVASAVGLIVTACVFFRPPPRPPQRKRRRTAAPPPPAVAGA
jgi:hypothetical protein